MVYEDVPADPSLAPPLPAGPFALVTRWLAEARERSGQDNPDAMALATADAAGRPSLRMVLCRGWDPEAGWLAFYTHHQSRKGRELDAQPWAAATFHWDALGRQARFEGPVVRAPEAASDAYFAGRPRASQIAAWASAQSRPIDSRATLLERLAEADARFGGEDGPPVPRPPFWGGYRLFPERVELWVGSAGRAHDRACWTCTLERESGGVRRGAWRVERLQP